MSIAPEDVHPSFDSNARKYRCCFGYFWHTRVCAKIIVALEAICMSATFLQALVGYVHHPIDKKSDKSIHLQIRPGQQNVSKINETSLEILDGNHELSFAIHAFFFVIVWMAVILVCCGINRIRPKCLLPHLFLQAISILYSMVMAVVYAVQNGKWWSVLTFPSKPALIMYILLCILDIYFFVCIFRCYRYLTAKRRASPVSRLEKPHTVVEMTGVGSPA